MNEFSKGQVFSDVSPDNQVTGDRLNNLVDEGTLLVGAIANKSDMGANATEDADMVLVQDVSDSGSNVPKKVGLANLLPQGVRYGKQQYAAGTLSGGVYAVTLSPAATTSYTTGMKLRFKADSANAGAVDINVNELGAKNLFTRAGAELAANDILANEIVEAVYDGTNFYVANALSAAQVTATHLTEAARAGIHQYAADSGSANTYAVTLSPAATAYTAGMVVRFKAANANTGAATLNVNGVGAINLKKSNGAALAANDILANQMVEAVYDGTNFQIGRVTTWDFTSTNTAIPGASAAATIAHGLGAVPSKLRVVLVQTNASAQQGYAQNEVVDIAGFTDHTANKPQFTVSADGTNITIAQTNVAAIDVIPKTGGAWTQITSGNWAIRAYASL